MSNHDPNGINLCIHSVVVEKNSRRKGVGSLILKQYLELVKRQHKNLQQITLVSKKHLISFYESAGFELVGESDLEHGKETWYELKMELNKN